MDWSSDFCSSDLIATGHQVEAVQRVQPFAQDLLDLVGLVERAQHGIARAPADIGGDRHPYRLFPPPDRVQRKQPGADEEIGCQIGRRWWRERVSQYEEIAGVAVA